MSEHEATPTNRSETTSKNIILFADGTGNSASTIFKTNVWRLYEALDLGGRDQVATFADGVGTSSFKPFEIVGLALGLGLKRRVLNLYKFLCLNYDPSDRVFLFGFSRGAFTVRLVAGILAREGLVEFQSHEELERNALAAYRSYRKKAFPGKWPWTRLGRNIRDGVVSKWNWLTGSRSYASCRPDSSSPRSPNNLPIAFLGVWDTVAAYGLPIDELTRAVDKWIWPLTFESSRLLPAVQCARQALSLDDERRTFFPIPWEATDSDGEPISTDGLLQVWFSGVHANVGGGYPDDRHAHIPLCWMIEEARKSGLKFNPDIVRRYEDIASANGRIYDSRENLGVFYRYHPRSVEALMKGVKPIIDGSVLSRMANGPDGYAPISLPRDFLVRGADGSILDLLSDISPAASPALGNPQFSRDVQLLSSRLANKENPGERIELVQDTVWWRRANYYVSLLLVIVAVAYPFFSEYVSSGALSQLDQSTMLVVGWLVGILKLFVPGLAEPWLNAIARHPAVAAGLISAIVASIWLSLFLSTRIADRSRIAWSNENWVKNQAQFDQEMRTSQKRVTSTIVVIGVLAGVVAMATDTVGAFVAFFLIALCALALRFVADSKKERNRFSFLGFARAIRTNKTAQHCYDLLRVYILPAAALTATGLLLIVMMNKVSVEMASAAGLFCAEEPKDEQDTKEFLGSGETRGFDLKSMCNDTGITLKKGERYRITISMEDGRLWKDKDTVSGVAGFPTGSLVHAAGVPLRRWWGYPYFQPIARIGNRGSNEKPLEPIRLKQKSAQEIKTAQFLFTPDQTGRLYLYLYDAAIGVPYLYDYFYRNNSGGTTIKIENVSGY
jgi:uncharacterized protein (DUF2235 family)